MLDSALEIPGALHAVLISADGLLMARTKDFDKDDADRVAAAMSGVQSLSRTLGFFCEDPQHRWRQTLVEFDGGWVFLISAGAGACRGACAGPAAGLAGITLRLQPPVAQLGKQRTAPRRGNLGVRS